MPASAPFRFDSDVIAAEELATRGAIRVNPAYVLAGDQKCQHGLDVPNYGADVRYSLMSYVPLAVFAGIGLAHGARALPGLMRAGWTDHAAAVVGAGLLFQFLWYAPLVRATGEEAWAARADVRYAKAFAAQLPPNSLVLTHNPNMFHLWGISAAQISIAATESQHVEQQLMSRYAGGVYLHWNFWCNVSDPLQVAFCEKTLAMYSHDLVDSHKERNYTYALYRLHK